jgi:hypothetical protein
MTSRKIAQLTWLIALPLAFPAAAQVVSRGERLDLTLEGYGNLTTANSQSISSPDRLDGSQTRLDAALRGLARWKNPSGPDLGLRVVAESAPEIHARIAEASLLVLGGAGRLELGKRPGLPDVLTGYAPNNFAFTSAEFGPASGPSLDPGGGLQNAFLAPGLAGQLNDLAALGASTSLANDRSTKLVYVSPKRNGFLAGVSYAPNAEDPRFNRLIQTGLVHERYWASNILRLGGSYTYAHANSESATPQKSLRSFNAGATLILNYDWMLGISGTWNGTSGLTGASLGPTSAAYGATASVNYNHGRWTAGAYYQLASSEGDPLVVGNDRLRAAEAGVSYRLTTKLRFYGAIYSFHFDNEGGTRRGDRHHGTELLLGVRATL